MIAAKPSAFDGVDAVAFDLDNTLYPDYRLWLASGIPFFMAHWPTVSALGKARVAIRDVAMGASGAKSFHEVQAELVARFMQTDPGTARTKLMAAYAAWERSFSRVKPFTGVRESLEALRERGYALAILSDFPPRVKLEAIGLSDFFPVALSSEDSGKLKPESEPFLMLANTLGLEPGRILFVGDSAKRDMEGARRAGMKTALFARKAPPGNPPDIAFSKWRDFLSLIREINR